MTTSILIARLIGPILIVTGLGGAIAPRSFETVGREFLASRALIYLAGILAMLIGLAILNTHNLWVADWPVIITIFGWLALIGGVIRVASPALTRRIGETMIGKPMVLRVSGACQLALGLLLSALAYL